MGCGMANNTAVKTKLCWNCEGNVPLSVDDCPYCGVQIEDVKLYGESVQKREFQSVKEENAVSDSPFGLYVREPAQESREEPSEQEQEMLSVFEDMKRILLPLLLLLSGSLFFTFGLSLYLFSEEGVMTLRWSDSYWPFYFGLGCLTLILGGRSLTRVDDSVGE